MNSSLPDVNVWLALVAEGHVHHLTAFDWFAAQPQSSIAFCRITQMSLLRLLTNFHVMGGSPRTIKTAWSIYSDLRRDGRVLFTPDDERMDTTWRQMMVASGIGPSSWTDAYLAAFASLHSQRLVTFDSGFKRWGNVEAFVLSPRPSSDIK